MTDHQYKAYRRCAMAYHSASTVAQRKRAVELWRRYGPSEGRPKQ